jgi:hypothetical protein
MSDVDTQKILRAIENNHVKLEVKLDRLSSAIFGNLETGEEGLRKQVEKNSDYIQYQKTKKKAIHTFVRNTVTIVSVTFTLIVGILKFIPNIKIFF